MTRRHAALAIATLASSPTVAFAQAVPTDESALYAGPLLLMAALLLLGIGEGLAHPGWSRLGVVLWILVMTAGGFLAVYAMQGAILGQRWQLPSLLAGFLAFILAGHGALNKLNGVKREPSS